MCGMKQKNIGKKSCVPPYQNLAMRAHKKLFPTTFSQIQALDYTVQSLDYIIQALDYIIQSLNQRISGSSASFDRQECYFLQGGS